MSQYTCGRCGGTVTRTTGQCPHCGTLLNGIKCSRCSCVYSQSLLNCPNCGTRNPESSQPTAISGKTATIVFAVIFSLGAVAMWLMQLFPTEAMRLGFENEMNTEWDFFAAFFYKDWGIVRIILSVLAIATWAIAIIKLRKSKA